MARRKKIEEVEEVEEKDMTYPCDQCAKMTEHRWEKVDGREELICTICG
jgi:hypothetical protein